MERRTFLSALASLGGALATPHGGYPRSPEGSARTVKPIMGSWFEFQHHSLPEGVYWNPACEEFTCGQWSGKVREIAELGMEYLVLMCTALRFKAFFDTRIFPKFELACGDPIETVLSEADDRGVKFFMGGGFYGDWASGDIITDPEASRKRLEAIEELTLRYGHHKSFYGWYWPNEAFINRYYRE